MATLRRDRIRDVIGATVLSVFVAGTAIAFIAPPSRTVPCAIVDLGDVAVCGERVLGVEADGFGGAVVATALDGVRIDYATEHSIETVARRLRAAR